MFVGKAFSLCKNANWDTRSKPDGHVDGPNTSLSIGERIRACRALTRSMNGNSAPDLNSLRGTSVARRAVMRIRIVGAAVLFSICGVPFVSAAQTPCVKPWAIADKWIDNHDVTQPVDQMWTPDDTFESVDANGNPLPDADVYRPISEPASTGFSLAADLGLRVFLRVSDAGAATHDFSFAVDISGAGGGAQAYRTAISTCDLANPTTVHIGDVLLTLTGNLHGPTLQAVTDLILQDQNAYWDDNNNQLAGSCADLEIPCAPFSPRLAVIALFDPAEFEVSKRSPGALQLRVANVVCVFIEGYANGFVFGRIAPFPEP